MAGKPAAQAPKKKRAAAQVRTALTRSNRLLDSLRQRAESQQAVVATEDVDHDPDIGRIVPIDGC